MLLVFMILLTLLLAKVHAVSSFILLCSDFDCKLGYRINIFCANLHWTSTYCSIYFAIAADAEVRCKQIGMFSPRRSQASSEAARRRLLLETYTTPLGLNLKRDDNNDNENKEADILALQSFLSKFYASHYTQQSRMERKAILEQYEEVKLYHEQLVAKVLSVEEFWQRYFFRCDPDQILSEWDRNKSRQDSMGLKDVSKSMSSWMDSVKKAVFEEEEEGKTTKNNEQIEKRDTSDKNSSVSNDSGNKDTTTSPGKGVISSFLETCRKIDNSHAEAAALAEAKHKKRKETEAKAKKIAEEKRRVTAEGK